jgi:hypothetical protein
VLNSIKKKRKEMKGRNPDPHQPPRINTGETLAPFFSQDVQFTLTVF